MAVFNRERSAMNANVPYEAENVGVRGHTTTVPLDQMQDIWLREKANWNGGMFPSGCASGKVCGHYTQMFWRDTKEVGCATAIGNDGTKNTSDYLVCRYSPLGNYNGQRPY